MLLTLFYLKVHKIVFILIYRQSNIFEQISFILSIYIILFKKKFFLGLKRQFF